MKNFLMLLIAGFVTGFVACKKSSAPAPPAAADSDRKITMTVDNMTPVAGTNVTFTLVAQNNGPAATTGVSVSDMLPTGYTLVSATATTGSYTASAWDGFDLASGGSATLTIVARINATGIYANTATISGVGNDPVPGNNSAMVTTIPTVPKVLMVSTLAGSTQGYMDGTGVAAQFSGPRGLGTDATGNVYVADAGNHRIRKITPAGMVSTLAGDGNSSTLYEPLGVAVDATGNVYVADADNSRICKVSASGVLTVLAGSATGGGGSGGYADGVGTAAKFNVPNGVVVDAGGNVYVTDARNYLIRKITPGGSVSTLAGSTEGYAEGEGATARFENLTGPSIDAAGNIYVGDIGNNRIRKITPGGVVSSVAGGAPLGYVDGPVATALFANPYATAIDAAGNIYVSDEDNNVIRKIGY